MKITDLLSASAIDIDASPIDKETAIQQLTMLMEKQGNLFDRLQYQKDVLKREALSTTGIGEGIAIPHAQSAAVNKAGISAMICRKGMDFDSLDGQPTYLFFMIAVPMSGGNEHLEILQRLSVILMDTTFRTQLLSCKNTSEFINCIDQKENENKIANTSKEGSEKIDIVAVTACPTGIAHTYMAAEALEQAAKELGVHIKVETNGSSGVKNLLTKQEIEQAKGIIVAADKKVEMTRFIDKPLLLTKVSEGVYHPHKLIEQVLEGNISVYQENMEAREEKELPESRTHQIYTHIMNGLSQILPILMIMGLVNACSYLMKQYVSNDTYAMYLSVIGVMISQLVLPIFSGYIGKGIADTPGFIIGIIGGVVVEIGGGGFIGAIVAGLISGYGMLVVKYVCNKIPEVLDGIKPMLLYPLLGTLGICFIMYIMNPILQSINQTLFSTISSMHIVLKIIMGAIFGGLMSADMGGPVNKWVYLIGVGSIIQGNTEIMAAVMIGGMMPPIIISVSTYYLKSKGAKIEDKNAFVNLIKGLTFVTEAAIPYVHRDRKNVLPACILGSAVAGALSVLFGCKLPVPHGGIFVILLVENFLFYLLALCIGAIVGAILLLYNKKIN
ncbi:MAG: fructose-specific PTS transporter subunit EIIC [Coprobacillaceae bacterium]